MKLDRMPKPAPFAVGTKLKYMGTCHSYTYDIRDGERKQVDLCVPGMIVTIRETRPGRRGTLRHLSDEEGPMFYEDTGEPVLDETQDAYSVYYVEAWQNGAQQGRCIHPDSADDWELVLGTEARNG